MTQIEQAKKLMNKLIQKGYTSYLVGGCVRDTLLNTKPNDYDITTNAKPDEIISCFPEYEVIETGIKHGTVTVVTKSGNFEITTYRIESDYSDFRHPDKVEFVDNINDDLGRRDFTINAMAMDIHGNIIDPYNGGVDIMRNLIRCVGNPDARFNEDPLRMLRAIRFSAKLGFSIETHTFKAIEKNARLISRISFERIREELKGILFYDPGKIDLLTRTGLLKILLPEVRRLSKVRQKNPHHHTDVYHHTLEALNYSKKFKLSKERLIAIRLALLLHDTGKYYTKSVGDDGYDHFYGHPEYSFKVADRVLKRFKFSTDEIALISRLVLYHDTDAVPSKRKLLIYLNKYQFDSETFKLMKYVKECDINVHDLDPGDHRLKDYKRLYNMYLNKVKNDKILSIDNLAISGNDIMRICNIKPSRLVGIIKKDLYEMCFVDESLNTYEYLTNYLQENKDKYLKED